MRIKRSRGLGDVYKRQELKDMFLQLTIMELRVIAFIAILGRHLDYVYRLLKWVTSKIRNKITGMF